MKASKQPLLPVPCVVATTNRNTAIVVDADEAAVMFIPLVGEAGFAVETLPAAQFKQLYQELPDYPVPRAAALYAGYAQALGATPEAMRYLGRHTPLSPKEIEMATAKKKAAAAAAPAKTAKKAAPAKAARSKRKSAEPKAEGAPRESAAQLFKDLIREGKLTDDQIFAKVQAKFGLDDKKRSYVAWYRNSLTKAGEKVPAPKAA